ncbi:alpha/beta hydrolase [Actinotignum schaalii]|uniref:alpha/beta hydrolase n=1 Tax=Actinotignum schaalii TaxID=59505 RepID=UPI000425912D|nr:alpha/beta hydrolase [Actinotignum schaalii]WQN44924.1 alpha/beta hydrolase [Actinotignum schaalii]
MRHSALSYSVSGAPIEGTIVAFHGVTDCAASLHSLAAHYGRDYRVVLCDLLGHGLSARFAKDDLADPFAALVATAADVVVRAAAGTPSRQVLLMGHSLGGAVAAHIAAAHPALIAGLVLEDPALLTPEQVQTYREAAESLGKTQERVREYLPEAIASLRESYTTWTPSEYAGWAQGKTEVDLDFIATGVVGRPGREVLGQLRMPTLLVTGDADDVLFGATGIEALAEHHNPQLRGVLIPHSTHTVRRDQECAFYAAVDPFLAECAKAQVRPQPYLDPQLTPLLASVPEQTTWDTPAMRAEGEALLGAEPELPAGIRREVLVENGLELRIFHPNSTTTPQPRVVLSLHGGGYVAGRARYDDARNAEIAQLTRATVVVPDYQLAPEHPFPAAVEDCRAALKFIARAFPDAPVLIFGDSAGAGLADQLLRFAPPEELAGLCGVVALEPCVSPRLDTLSYRTYRDGPVWTREAAAAAWSAYVGDSGYRAEPISAGSGPYADLPMFLVVNPVDPLRDEGLDWARDLMDAGAAVELHMYPGTFHGMLSAPGTDVWAQVRTQMSDFIAAAFAKPLPTSQLSTHELSTSTIERQNNE